MLGGYAIEALDAVVYYEESLLTFERLLETYIGAAPRGSRSFTSAMTVWLGEKLFLKHKLKQELNQLRRDPSAALPPLLFSEHHLSHAAAAFYPSPFEQAPVLLSLIPLCRCARTEQSCVWFVRG